MSPFIPEVVQSEAPTVEQQIDELYDLNNNFRHKLSYITQRILKYPSFNYYFYPVESEGVHYLTLCCRRENESLYEEKSYCIPFNIDFGGDSQSSIGIDYRTGDVPGSLYKLEKGTPIFTDEERTQLSQFAQKYSIQTDKETVRKELLKSVT